MRIVELNDPTEEGAVSSFLEVSAAVYRDDPVWVPASENLFVQRFKASAEKSACFRPLVVFQDEIPVARVTAILPGAVDAAGRTQGWLGFFEARKEYPEAARAVLERAEVLLREAGAKSILAPKIDNMVAGLLAGGFSLPQTVFTAHNPPYYAGIFKEAGYLDKTRLRTFVFTRDTARRFEYMKPGFITRTFNRGRLAEEIRVFHSLQGVIFNGSLGYVPRTLEEDGAFVESFLPFIDDDLVIIAEDGRGKAVGLLVCLPDAYQRSRCELVDRARLISIGVLPGKERHGVGAMMVSHLAGSLFNKGYMSVEASWIIEANHAPQNLAKRFNPNPGREFLLQEKEL